LNEGVVEKRIAVEGSQGAVEVFREGTVWEECEGEGEGGEGDEYEELSTGGGKLQQ